MNRAAIIGGGVIGSAWAARFALMGWDVRVCDPADKTGAVLHEVLREARRALPMLYDIALPAEGRVDLVQTIAEACDGADWVQESVGETLELKYRVLAQIEAATDPITPIGSSTSGFKPSQLRYGARYPGRILVAHPFNPVYLLPLVEVVPGEGADPAAVKRAKAILTAIGMHALLVRVEIDAHIADRLLEAVWREALWLVRDDIATTQEVDDAIRYGFGLRWAQMGLFETYRLAGGANGMAHFIAQFGPALAWPWSRLTDVPALDDALVAKIAVQSDRQSGHRTAAALRRERDDNLVSILRALKARGSAAGVLVKAHEKTLSPAPDDRVPLITLRRTVPIDWTDYNGHMNEGRYGQVFSDAADIVMALIGADADYIAAGQSYFTAETTVKYHAEALAGETFHVETRVTMGQGRKLRLWHEMKRECVTLASCDQFLLHVDLATRKSCDPPPSILERLQSLAAKHGAET